MKILTTKEANTNLWVIFFLWPVGALITSIKYYRQNWAKNGLWLFIVFFGFTFIVQDGQDSSYILSIFWLFAAQIQLLLIADVLYSRVRDIRYISATGYYACSAFTGIPVINGSFCSFLILLFPEYLVSNW